MKTASSLVLAGVCRSPEIPRKQSRGDRRVNLAQCSGMKKPAGEPLKEDNTTLSSRKMRSPRLGKRSGRRDAVRWGGEGRMGGRNRDKRGVAYAQRAVLFKTEIDGDWICQRLYLTKHATARAGTNWTAVWLLVLVALDHWQFIGAHNWQGPVKLHRSRQGQTNGQGSGARTREPGNTQSIKGFIMFPQAFPSKNRRNCEGTPIFYGLTASAV